MNTLGCGFTDVILGVGLSGAYLDMIINSHTLPRTEKKVCDIPEME